MAEHEPSIGLSSGWLTPKPIFSGLGLTFELDPAHPGWENPYCVVPTRPRQTPGSQNLGSSLRVF
jgi:hypothetical protein